MYVLGFFFYGIYFLIIQIVKWHWIIGLYILILYIVWGTLTYIMYMIHIYNMYYI